MKDNVIRSTSVVGICIALSRLTGVFKTMMMGYFFGTSLAQSAFVVAFIIPNLFRRLFGEGALSAAFIPVFSESLEKEGKDKAWQLASAVMTLLGTVLVLIVVVVLLGVSVCIKYVPLGEKAALVLPLLRIMFPYMFFICMAALCMAILNSFRHFLVPAATPVLFNILFISALLIICPISGLVRDKWIYVAAWAVVAGGIAQLAVQYPLLKRYGYRFGLSFAWHDERIRRMLRLMAPAAIGAGVIQLNVLIDQSWGLLLEKWAPAALFMGELVVDMPLGIFGTALGTVLLPTFSRQVAQVKPEEVRNTLNQSLRILLFVMIPASVGLVVLGRPIVELIFQWKGGMFGSQSVIQTTRALVFYAPGLVVFGLYKALVPVFYAYQDTRTPVRVAIWVVVLNCVLNTVFIFTWPWGYKHAGIAFASVISSLVNCIALGYVLNRRIGSPGWSQIFIMGFKAAVASAIMGVLAYYSCGFIGKLTISSGIMLKVSQLIALAGSIIVSCIAYFGISVLICPKELRIFIGGLFRRG